MTAVDERVSGWVVAFTPSSLLSEEEIEKILSTPVRSFVKVSADGRRPAEEVTAAVLAKLGPPSSTSPINDRVVVFFAQDYARDHASRLITVVDAPGARVLPRNSVDMEPAEILRRAYRNSPWGSARETYVVVSAYDEELVRALSTDQDELLVIDLRILDGEMFARGEIWRGQE